MKNQTNHERLKDLMAVRPWAASAYAGGILQAFSYFRRCFMECITAKRHSKEYLDKEEFGFRLEKAIGRVHYLSCSLPEYPHAISEKEISGIVSILDGIQDDLEAIYEGHFQKDEASPQ
jgi:hypothetical protein